MSEVMLAPLGGLKPENKRKSPSFLDKVDDDGRAMMANSPGSSFVNPTAVISDGDGPAVPLSEGQVTREINKNSCCHQISAHGASNRCALGYRSVARAYANRTASLWQYRALQGTWQGDQVSQAVLSGDQPDVAALYDMCLVKHLLKPMTDHYKSELYKGSLLIRNQRLRRSSGQKMKKINRLGGRHSHNRFVPGQQGKRYYVHSSLGSSVGGMHEGNLGEVSSLRPSM
jgi:hypothetical protein